MMKTLYVGNISWGTSEEDLRNSFANHAEVLGCRIITERATGRSRGYGFVEVKDEDVDKVVEAMNGAEIDGRRLVVNEAKPRD
ncbi:MAG: RNA-binding protein [Bacillota bacterium]